MSTSCQEGLQHEPAWIVVRTFVRTCSVSSRNAARRLGTLSPSIDTDSVTIPKAIFCCQGGRREVQTCLSRNRRSLLSPAHNISTDGCGANEPAFLKAIS